MFLAAGSNRTIAIRLLDAGADANTTNKDGYSALHQAVSSRQVDVVKELLAHGANKNARWRTHTPLDFAEGRSDMKEIIDALKSY